ncbi:MAG: DUF1320 domain-containing protein [Opitutaceae bacterium]|nr:DUF1320 domain-containing protein [Opitutaceae bacterium]
MPYATQSDLAARFGEAELLQQTDLTGTGAINGQAVADALTDASALIDGYVSARYSLPLAVVPGLLVGVCCDLARYALYIEAVPPIVQQRRDQAIATLRDISLGKLRLEVGGDTPSVPAPSGLAQVVQAGRKVFGGGLR